MERGRTHTNTSAFFSSVRRSSRLSAMSYGLVVGTIMPLAGPPRSSRCCVDYSVITLQSRIPM